MVVTAAFSTPASAACRQALAIGLDISGSVDAAEYRLQLDGLASALLDADVQAAFLAMPDAYVRLFIYEWAGYSTQRPLIEWTAITDAAILQSIADVLISTKRQPHEPGTALGQAMKFGSEAVLQQSDCWRLTIDLSGDGKSNIGPLPADTRNQPDMGDITVNALVIGADAPAFTDERSSEIAQLSAYFRSEVIRGPDAFIETAIEFKSFRDAMARKLLRELQTRAVGALDTDDQRPPDQ